uniref:Pentatricopeptide repeat-containing protein n=1 Tax=Ananas comosus var. bracteatus TaxID=296719 RepID=A0A6V7NXN0_ANACO|nr:unnamed protein product [Ananas comosus var. bracteatus]
MASSLSAPSNYRLCRTFNTIPSKTNTRYCSFILLLGRGTSDSFPTNAPFTAPTMNPNTARVYSSNKDSVSTENSDPGLLNGDLLRRLSSLKDADQVIEMIVEAERSAGNGVLETEDCNSIIEAAFDRGNVDLALSVFVAMQTGYAQDGMGGKILAIARWKWARPDVQTYGLMVQRLAASLRVSDALRIIDYVSRVGVSSGEEVPFGVVVRCPTCMIAIAVAQPQHGSQFNDLTVISELDLLSLATWRSIEVEVLSLPTWRSI